MVFVLDPLSMPSTVDDRVPSMLLLGRAVPFSFIDLISISLSAILCHGGFNSITRLSVSVCF
jgi:hypothetical protein